MSRYFSLTETTDEKIIGKHYPQCSGFLTGYNNEYENPYSMFCFAYQKGKRINYKPDLSSIKIPEKTKLTDLISCSLGPGNDLVVSERLKNILNESKSSQYQIFETLLNKKNERFKYWWIHFIYDLEKTVDFEASTLFHANKSLNKKVKSIKNYSEYLEFYDNEDTFGLVRTTNTVLKHEPLDFFIVGQFNQTRYVSEKLMNRINSEGITGIEFAEANDIHFCLNN